MVNDTLGHDKGNELICGFSAILVEQFTRYEPFRTSGDEFLAVSIDDEEDAFLKNAGAFMKLLNQDGFPRAAVGFAWRSGNHIASVTAEAETRMYEDNQVCELILLYL